MKFEVQYPNGTQHEVELQGTIAVLGRDPSCDLVLNDSKCSRRHAVLEAGPQGISIRDSGSANGIYVNGSKVERANLREGDVVRLGEVTMKVLPEEISGTVVMGPEDMADLRADTPESRKLPRAVPPPPRAEAPSPPPTPTPPPAPPPPPRITAPPPPPPPARRPAAAPPRPAPERPRPAPSRSGEEPIERPLTVTVLAALWVLSMLLYGIGGLALAFVGREAGLWAIIPALAGLVLALVCAVMAFGLWSRSPWARFLQIGLAVLGVCSPAMLTSILILIYFMRQEAKIQFSGRREYSELAPSEARIVRENASDAAFAFSILGSLLVAALVVGLLAAFANPWSKRPGFGPEARAVERLQVVAAAQEAFRAGTCDAYADLEGLIHPSAVIPNYPPGGPAFLDARYGSPEDAGYRFDLRVEEPVAPTDGCPERSYRRFAYAALPQSGTGAHFVVGPDRVVRMAEGRPAGPQDPAAAEVQFAGRD